MSAEFAKDYLHGDLREIREVMPASSAAAWRRSTSRVSHGAGR